MSSEWQTGQIMSAGSKSFETDAPSCIALGAKRFRFEESSTSSSKRPASWKTLCASASISFVVHVLLLLILSMIYFDVPTRAAFDAVLSLVVGQQPAAEDDVDIELVTEFEPPSETPLDPVDDPNPDLEEELSESVEMALASVELKPNSNAPATEKIVPVQPRVSVTPPTVPAPKSKVSKKGDSSVAVEDRHADHFVGRTTATKAALLKRMGGTDESEAAVARGLVWLKNHQLPDGSWSFDHTHSPECNCTMPGRLANNLNGATAMALLAFLGAGQTHQEGEYQSVVRRGIDSLLKGGTPVGKGICFYGNLQGPPTYYTHGLVTIALSEAHAMTHDAELRPAVAGAVEFLVATQHSQGGWRYFPGQPGDTSVVAWELMALKSAQFSRIKVPPKVFGGIDRFLGSVSSMRGSQYAYTPERKNIPTPSMTAAGLLCRMYLDWNETNGGLRAGIHFLDEHGPEPDDMYYNYYATQVLHHWGGDEWDRWNKVMREHLISTQIRRTHAAGSWDVADRHGNMGGRLYMTSLALLTLEVYYRHLPLYQRDRIEIPLNPAAEAK